MDNYLDDGVAKPSASACSRILKEHHVATIPHDAKRFFSRRDHETDDEPNDPDLEMQERISHTIWEVATVQIQDLKARGILPIFDRFHFSAAVTR